MENENNLDQGEDRLPTTNSKNMTKDYTPPPLVGYQDLTSITDSHQ
jgi:hypothetical protein